MKIKLLLTGFLFLTACKSQKSPLDTGCPTVMCTEEFKMIPVKLISSSGKSTDFKSYKIMETASGKEIKLNNDLPNTADNAKTLIVADDSQLRNFTEKGTDLQLLITRTDDKIVKANYKISGGKCACHVAKLNGPDQVDIDQL
ncbi:hypothetical protein [Mucilaginibacter terrae]|uniref:Copper resistance protein NlpE n=1 Tax=Mucilaginibacter terrae TaxID=1955052 RepID=A0ABU3GPE5_9SPHI|nr:hypothetical protein [Mucilaginibacter terrae]MDT3401649.1 hypothetical protein [Mucilaginibacter terrae]